MSNKIPIKRLLLHITNVINACDLTSVTVYRIKQYLKHRFKDRLPCDNDLDIILESVIKSIKFSQALNPCSVPLEEGNYESLYSDSSEENEMRDFQDKPIKKRILNNRRILRICYLLKKGTDEGPNTRRARSCSIKDPHTSKTVKIIKPFLTNNKGSCGANDFEQVTAKITSSENMVPCISTEKEQRTVLQNKQKTKIKGRAKEKRRKKGTKKSEILPTITEETSENCKEFFVEGYKQNADTKILEEKTEASENCKEFFLEGHEQNADTKILEENTESSRDSEDEVLKKKAGRKFSKVLKKKAGRKFSKQNKRVKKHSSKKNNFNYDEASDKECIDSCDSENSDKKDGDSSFKYEIKKYENPLKLCVLKKKTQVANKASKAVTQETITVLPKVITEASEEFFARNSEHYADTKVSKENTNENYDHTHGKKTTPKRGSLFRKSSALTNFKKLFENLLTDEQIKKIVDSSDSYEDAVAKCTAIITEQKQLQEKGLCRDNQRTDYF